MIHHVMSQTNHTIKIVGSITDTNGKALSGVNIIIRNDTFWKGIVSDASGNYELDKIPKGNYSLQASYIGYKPTSIPLELDSKSEYKVNLTLGADNFLLEDVKVNGKSITAKINQQAYEVEAVSSKGLENSSTDAKAIINRISGVRILENGGLGSESTFTLNGFSGNQVKFFMDGIPIDNWGSSMSLADIPVNLIDHIEVYKGVVPVSLGTDALGGAVNIITKKGSKYLDASYSYGSFNTHRASVNSAYTKKNGFTVRANAFYNYSDNDYKVYAKVVNSETKRSYNAWVKRFHDRYRSGTVNVEAGVTNKSYADNLMIGITGSANDKQVQTGATMATVFGGIVTNSKNVIGTVKYKKKDLLLEGLDINFSGAYNLVESQAIDTLSGVTYNWLGDYTITYDSNGDRSTDGEYERQFTTKNDNEVSTQLNMGYKLSSNSSLVLNYAFNYFHRKQYDKEDPDDVSNSFPKSLNKNLLGLSYKLGLKKWNATVFAKYYALSAKSSKQYDFALSTQRTVKYHSSNDCFGYGLATSYTPFSPLQVKLSYEHTYRLPDPEEIFGNGLFTDANPDLGPEQSNNVNIGFKWNITDYKVHKIDIGTSFIYRNATNMIYEVVSYGSPVTSYDNLGKVRTLGLEGNIQYKWKDLFHMAANVTYQNITDRAKKVYNESYTSTGWEKNTAYGYRLPNTPYFFGNVKTGLKFDNMIKQGNTLNFNYYLNFTERYFLTWVEFGSDNSKYVIPRQLSHDMEISYSLKNGKYNISAECRNIFDAKLYDKYYLQKPGRAFYIKLRYNL